jgi:Kdo2-lipid IVA lauroyltransferase/acyltransferase
VIAVCRWLGAVLGFIAGSVLRIRRRHVDESMERIGARKAARAMYRALGTSVIELLWLACMSKARRDAMLDRYVDLEGVPSGAAVLAASHTGNWELAAAAVARTRPLFVVAKPFTSSWFDRFVARMRARLGIRTIDPRGASAAVVQALRSGALVVMPIDQVPDRASHATTAIFLGERAHVDRAPFVPARRANAEVVVCAARRDGDVHRIRALASVSDAIEATAVLDRFVRAHPESWMWLHRRWRKPGDRLEKSAWTTPSSSPASASRAA